MSALAGRGAIVTGASQGLGRAIALRFAEGKGRAIVRLRWKQQQASGNAPQTYPRASIAETTL